MPDEWFFLAQGRTHGPLTMDALLELLESRRLSWRARVAPADAGRWRRARRWDELTLRSAERYDQASRHRAAVVVTVPPPPPGEAWFHPLSAATVAFLDVATLSLYHIVWKYHHRRWALRRAGQPTSSFWSVIKGAFALDTQVARVAEQLGVRRTFSFYLEPQGWVPSLGGLLVLLALWPFAIAYFDAGIQRTANRVNRVVAPDKRIPLGGWLEVAVGLLVAGTAAVFLGLRALVT
jgi:hypothetical protein